MLINIKTKIMHIYLHFVYNFKRERIMLRKIIPLIVLMFFASSISFAGDVAMKEKQTDDKIYRVGIMLGQPPFSYVNKIGQYEGLTLKLWEFIAKDLNIKYDRKNVILDKRPKSTAEGKVSSATLLKYIFKKYNCKENEIIILLQPTSPSRKPEDIKKAFSLFKRKRMPVVSVFEAKKLQDNLCALERKNLMKKIQIKKEKIYQINGAIYIFSVRQFKKEKTIPQNEFVPYIMDEKDSVDIDKYSDYIKAVLLH